MSYTKPVTPLLESMQGLGLSTEDMNAMRKLAGIQAAPIKKPFEASLALQEAQVVRAENALMETLALPTAARAPVAAAGALQGWSNPNSNSLNEGVKRFAPVTQATTYGDGVSMYGWRSRSNRLGGRKSA